MPIGSALKAGCRLSVVALLLAGCAAAGDSAQAIRDSVERAAAAAEADGEYVAAAGHYSNLLDRRPDDLEAALGLARNLRYAGRAKQAVEVMDKVAGTFGDGAPFILERAKANIAVGNLDDAVALLSKARAKDDGNWEIHATLGIAYDLTEKFGNARESYARALQLSKDNPVVLNNMAMSAALSGDIERAIATLENAPNVARHSPQVRQNLALFYGIKGDMEKAEALARMDLDEESVRNNLAVFARIRGDRTPAPRPK